MRCRRLRRLRTVSAKRRLRFRISSASVTALSWVTPTRTAFERAAYDWDAELSIYLAQGTHGHGVGTTVLACLIDLLELQGLRHLYSCVTLPNEKSIRMQRRLGFTDAGVWHDSGWKFDGWHDVAWLEKHIGSGKPQPVTPFPALDEKNIQECLQKYMDKLNQVEE